ncbi:MAG: hypothetical protein C5S48_01565 [Candidatus Methanogaster sp.]|nr:MAG: hypothetical protein C5S48_01565 [ANME-2 cluster archaeon]
MSRIRRSTLTTGRPDIDDWQLNHRHTVLTSSFHFNDRRFILREPVICSPEYRNNLWVYECPRYGLHAFSEDRQEALRQLGEEFAFLYEGLIDEPDEKLTPDAIELRDLLKADSVRVEEI